MLELKKIKYHPATALNPILTDVNISVNKGTPLVIAGASGSGKSSLIEIISGLSKPQHGYIRFQGKIASERKRRSISGVVFQFPERHFIGLTVLEELRLGHRRLASDKIDETLTKVGLSSLILKSPPENLSGGQQRRLAIAVQLTRNPSILLLDEPTAGLDWSVRDEIIKVIKDLSSNIILIVVTHEPQIFQDSKISSYQLNNGRLIKTIQPHKTKEPPCQTN